MIPYSLDIWVFPEQFTVCWTECIGLAFLKDVWSYIASCSVCLARKSPCPRRALMGHVSVGHRWDRVAMDILDMSVATSKGNRYVCVDGLFFTLN